MKTSSFYSEETRGDQIELIRQLAHEHFIELGIGTDGEFDKLWQDAFGEQEAKLKTVRDL